MDKKFRSLESSEDLSILNGHAFEEYLTQLFSDLGYRAEKTPGSGDFGADLLLRRRDGLIAVQAKQYASDVGFDAVKEIHFAKTFYEADEAWVVCTGGFTKQAEDAARATGVRLVGARELDVLIAKAHRGETEADQPYGRTVDPDYFKGPEGNVPAGLAFERAWRKPTFKAQDIADTLSLSPAKAAAVCKAMGWEKVPSTEKVAVYSAGWMSDNYSDYDLALGREFESKWAEPAFGVEDVASFLGVSPAKASLVCRAMGWEEDHDSKPGTFVVDWQDRAN